MEETDATISQAVSDDATLSQVMSELAEPRAGYVRIQVLVDGKIVAAASVSKDSCVRAVSHEVSREIPAQLRKIAKEMRGP